MVDVLFSIRILTKIVKILVLSMTPELECAGIVRNDSVMSIGLNFGAGGHTGSGE